MVEKKWYVVHTYSGYENKVKANLEKRVESMEVDNLIFRVEVPTEEVTELKDGKKRKVKRKIFPGYVLVQMKMTDESWYVVRNTPGVTGFVGPGSKPVPLSDDEVARLLGEQEEAEQTPIQIDFSEGETVRIISGPFQNFDGVIEAIQPARRRVRVRVSMFGRETPVELDFNQIEKLE